MSALLGSAGRPLLSPLPATTLFQDSPSAVQSVALPGVPQTLPSGGGGEESILQQSMQPAASAVTTSDVDTSSTDPVTTSTDPLPGSASTRASTTATPPVSSDPQLSSVTEGSPSVRRRRRRPGPLPRCAATAGPVARLFGALMPKGERVRGSWS